MDDTDIEPFGQNRLKKTIDIQQNTEMAKWIQQLLKDLDTDLSDCINKSNQE